MRRAAFDESAMGDRPGPAPEPARRRHDCAAHGCPMAGSMNFGDGWTCAYHHGEPSQEWGAITRAILAHKDLRDIVTECRRWFATKLNPGKTEASDMHKRLADLARMAGYSVPEATAGDDLRAFAYRCELLLAELVRRHVGEARKRRRQEVAA